MTEPDPSAPRLPPASADAYHDVQAEVDKHFAGSWEGFLKALANPSEVLHFVMWEHCKGDREKFQTWAEDKKLPPDWVPRFYGLLDPEGHLPAPEPAPEAEQS